MNEKEQNRMCFIMLIVVYIFIHNDYNTNTCSVGIEGGADAYGDGIVNGQDVVRLKKYIANYDYTTETSTVVLGPQN